MYQQHERHGDGRMIPQHHQRPQQQQQHDDDNGNDRPSRQQQRRRARHPNCNSNSEEEQRQQQRRWQQHSPWQQQRRIGRLQDGIHHCSSNSNSNSNTKVRDDNDMIQQRQQHYKLSHLSQSSSQHGNHHHQQQQQHGHTNHSGHHPPPTSHSHHLHNHHHDNHHDDDDDEWTLQTFYNHQHNQNNQNQNHPHHLQTNYEHDSINVNRIITSSSAIIITDVANKSNDATRKNLLLEQHPHQQQQQNNHLQQQQQQQQQKRLYDCKAGTTKLVSAIIVIIVIIIFATATIGILGLTARNDDDYDVSSSLLVNTEKENNGAQSYNNITDASSSSSSSSRNLVQESKSNSNLFYHRAGSSPPPSRTSNGNRKKRSNSNIFNNNNNNNNDATSTSTSTPLTSSRLNTATEQQVQFCPTQHSLMSQDLILRASYGHIFSISTVPKEKNNNAGNNHNNLFDNINDIDDIDDIDSSATTATPIATATTDTITITTLSLRMTNIQPGSHYEVWLYTGNNNGNVNNDDQPQPQRPQLNANDLDNDPTNNNIIPPSNGTYANSRANFNDWTLISNGLESDLVLDTEFFDANGHAADVGTTATTTTTNANANSNTNTNTSSSSYNNMEQVTSALRHDNDLHLRNDGGRDSFTAEGEMTTSYLYRIPQEKFVPLLLPTNQNGKLTLFVTLDRIGLQYGGGTTTTTTFDNNNDLELELLDSVDVAKDDYATEEVPSLDRRNAHVDLRMHVGEGVVVYPWLEDDFFYETRRFLGKVWYDAEVPCEYYNYYNVEDGLGDDDGMMMGAEEEEEYGSNQESGNLPSMSPSPATVASTSTTATPSSSISDNTAGGTSTVVGGTMMETELTMSILVNDDIKEKMNSTIQELFEKQVVDFTEDHLAQYYCLHDPSIHVTNQELTPISFDALASSSSQSPIVGSRSSGHGGDIANNARYRDAAGIRNLRLNNELLTVKKSSAVPTHQHRHNTARSRLLSAAAFTILDVTLSLEVLHVENCSGTHNNTTLDEMDLASVVETFINDHSEELQQKLNGLLNEVIGVSADAVVGPAEKTNPKGSASSISTEEQAAQNKPATGVVIGSAIVGSSIALCFLCIMIVLYRRHKKKEGELVLIQQEYLGEDMKCKQLAGDTVTVEQRTNNIPGCLMEKKQNDAPPPEAEADEDSCIGSAAKDDADGYFAETLSDKSSIGSIAEDDNDHQTKVDPQDSTTLPCAAASKPLLDSRDMEGNVEDSFSNNDVRLIEQNSVPNNDCVLDDTLVNSANLQKEVVDPDFGDSKEAVTRGSPAVLQKVENLVAQLKRLKHFEGDDAGSNVDSGNDDFMMVADSNVEDQLAWLMSQIEKLETRRERKYATSNQNSFTSGRHDDQNKLRLTSSANCEEEEELEVKPTPKLKHVKIEATPKKVEDQSSSDDATQTFDTDAYNKSLAVHADAHTYKWVRVKVPLSVTGSPVKRNEVTDSVEGSKDDETSGISPSTKENGANDNC